MKSELLDWEISLREMRDSFDDSFANAPPILENNEKEDFLVIQIYQDQYAVQVNELKALQIKKKIIPIPCENKSLLGLAGMQGQVIPIFSLASILNIQSLSNEEFGKENNFIICGNISQIGLAFLKLGSYHQINKKDIIKQQTTQKNFVSLMVRFYVEGSKELMVLPILDLALITNFISERS
jgi:chemotaxis signal transduction protein